MAFNSRKQESDIASAKSFYSYMQENDIESIASIEEISNFNPKDLLRNNKIDEKMSKLLSLQLYKRKKSEEPKRNREKLKNTQKKNSVIINHSSTKFTEFSSNNLIFETKESFSKKSYLEPNERFRSRDRFLRSSGGLKFTKKKGREGYLKRKDLSIGNFHEKQKKLKNLTPKKLGFRRFNNFGLRKDSKRSNSRNSAFEYSYRNGFAYEFEKSFEKLYRKSIFPHTTKSNKKKDIVFNIVFPKSGRAPSLKRSIQSQGRDRKLNSKASILNWKNLKVNLKEISKLVKSHKTNKVQRISNLNSNSKKTQNFLESRVKRELDNPTAKKKHKSNLRSPRAKFGTFETRHERSYRKSKKRGLGDTIKTNKGKYSRLMQMQKYGKQTSTVKKYGSYVKNNNSKIGSLRTSTRKGKNVWSEKDIPNRNISPRLKVRKKKHKEKDTIKQILNKIKKMSKI